MNRDQKVIARSGYTFLDYLSDIGGMQGMIISGVGYIIAIWNFNMFDNHMVTRLYKMKRPDSENNDQKSWGEKSEFMSPQILYNPKDCIRDLCPSFVCSRIMKSNRRERAFEKARKALEKEINIIEIIKSRRFSNEAIKYLLSKKQRMKIKERSRYHTVDPDHSPEPEDKTKSRYKTEDFGVSQIEQFTDGFYSSSSDNDADFPSSSKIEKGSHDKANKRPVGDNNEFGHESD